MNKPCLKSNPSMEPSEMDNPWPVVFALDAEGEGQERKVYRYLEMVRASFSNATALPANLPELFRSEAVRLYMKQMPHPSDSLDDEVIQLLEVSHYVTTLKNCSNVVTEFLDTFKQKDSLEKSGGD